MKVSFQQRSNGDAETQGNDPRYENSVRMMAQGGRNSQGVVVLETEGSAGISVRVAEELERVVNDGSRQRILPVIGTGSLQNITDLRLLDRCCYPSEGCARLRKAAEPRSPYRIVDDLHYRPV